MAVAVFSSIVLSCKKDVGKLPVAVVVDTCTTNIKYLKDIAPIITRSCAKPGCHTPTGYKDFTSYSSLSAEIGAIGKIGFYNRIKTGTDMPLGGPPLSSCDLQKIQAWFDEGVLNN